MMHCCTSRRIATVITCALLSPLAAEAELLVYEPFDYEAGEVLDGLPATGINLTGSYGATHTPSYALRIASPGLSYGNLLGSLPEVGGSRLNQVDGGTSGVHTVTIDEDVLIPTGNSIYFSALFTFDDSEYGNRLANITMLDDEGGEIVFGEAGVGSQAIRVSAQTPATGGGTVAAGADGSFTNGQTLWLIGRYFNSAEPQADTLELIGYDTAVAQTIASTFDRSDPNAQFAYLLDDVDIDVTRITSLRFTIRGDNNHDIDELRIGDTYADVALPEPAAGAVLLALLSAARRRP